jgi:hypothetical protein
MIFDFRKNGYAALAIAKYPQPTAMIGHVAGDFPRIKWVYIAANYGLIIIIADIDLPRLIKAGRKFLDRHCSEWIVESDKLSSRLLYQLFTSLSDNQGE